MTSSLLAQTAAKALLMSHYQPQRALASNVKLMLNAPAFSFTSAQLLDAQHELMNAWNAEADDELQDKLTMTEVSVAQQILALKMVPLADKCIVLASMPIIDVQQAAGFLGLAELEFNHFIAFHHDIFGKSYMNRRRYSVDELMLIHSNPEWLSNYRKPRAPAAAPMPGYLLFGRFTVVEEKLAMAFCNITRDELPKVAHVTSRNILTYYLVDLDKIRVAKLEAQQQ